MNKNDAIEMVVKTVNTNDEALEKGLLGLFARQTAKEVEVRDTRYKNGNGFYPRDVKVLQPAAEIVSKGMGLDPEVKALVRARVARYGRQLLEILGDEMGIVLNPRGRPARVQAV